MKKCVLNAAVLSLVTTSAFASVKLVNKDSDNYDITIKCSSTTQTSIGSNVSRDIGNGPCEVTIKSSGVSETGADGETLVIQGGKFKKQ